MNRLKLIMRLALVALAALFLAAGVLKVLDPTGFAADLARYRLVSQPVAAAVALYLPWLEIALGLALVSRNWRRPAAVLLLALMVVFTAALLSAWWRGIDLRCGCFGDRLAMPLAWSLVRNAAVTAGLAVVLLFGGRPVAAERVAPGR